MQTVIVSAKFEILFFQQLNEYYIQHCGSMHLFAYGLSLRNYVMEVQIDQSCFVPGISISLQKKYFYCTNWFSLVTMLASVWFFMSNAGVIIALFRSGIRSLSPGLLIVCSLSLTDFLWGAVVAPVNSGFRIKHLRNNQVCEVYSEMIEIPLLRPVVMCLLGTFGNLAVLSIDCYLAVKDWDQYNFRVTRCRAVVACSLVWLTTTTMATLRHVGLLHPTPFNFFLAVFMIPLAAVIIIFQVLTIHYFRKLNNAVAELMEGGHQNNHHDNVNVAIERRLTNTTTYVVGVLAWVFIPYVL